jgi:hypothetical protein
MRIKQIGDLIEITTEIYQAKNGGIFMNFGNTVIKLSKDDAEIVAYDIPNFDLEQYKKFYNLSIKENEK